MCNDSKEIKVKQSKIALKENEEREMERNCKITELVHFLDNDQNTNLSYKENISNNSDQRTKDAISPLRSNSRLSDETESFER